MDLYLATKINQFIFCVYIIFLLLIIIMNMVRKVRIYKHIKNLDESVIIDKKINALNFPIGFFVGFFYLLQYAAMYKFLAYIAIPIIFVQIGIALYVVALLTLLFTKTIITANGILHEGKIIYWNQICSYEWVNMPVSDHPIIIIKFYHDEIKLKHVKIRVKGEKVNTLNHLLEGSCVT